MAAWRSCSLLLSRPADVRRGREEAVENDDDHTDEDPLFITPVDESSYIA